MRWAVVPLAMLVLLQPAGASTVETFVSPDSSYPAASGFMEDATSSIILSTYTYGSPDMTRLLLRKKSEGADVRVLVEKSPAGGVPDDENMLLCALSEAGIPVLLYDGPLKYMHAKYIVRDGESVLVSSENFGYSGYFPDGTYGNRGWGAVIHDEGTAKAFSETFSEDAGNSIPFSCGMEDYTIGDWDPNGAHAPAYGVSSYDAQDVEFISSPDSLDGLLEMIDSAKDYILVEQFYVYTHWGSPTYDTTESAPSPLIEALRRKADEGVEVKVLLDSTYYNMDEGSSTSNAKTIMLLNCMGEEGRPIEAAAIDSDLHGLSVLHNKGLITDGSAALVSSINWNENSIMNNRETGVVIRGDAASYYEDVFWDDWDGATVLDCNGSRSIAVGRPVAERPTFWALIPTLASLAVLSVLAFYLSKRKNSKWF